MEKAVEFNRERPLMEKAKRSIVLSFPLESMTKLFCCEWRELKFFIVSPDGIVRSIRWAARCLLLSWPGKVIDTIKWATLLWWPPASLRLEWALNYFSISKDLHISQHIHEKIASNFFNASSWKFVGSVFELPHFSCFTSKRGCVELKLNVPTNF